MIIRKLGKPLDYNELHHSRILFTAPQLYSSFRPLPANATGSINIGSADH